MDELDAFPGQLSQFVSDDVTESAQLLISWRINFPKLCKLEGCQDNQQPLDGPGQSHAWVVRKVGLGRVIKLVNSLALSWVREYVRCGGGIGLIWAWVLAD